MRDIELLAPAANADIAIEAIRHGADAVYIGGPSHGARKKAANSLDDIRRVVDFAHPFGAKVYVTVNTIIYDNELRDVERLIRNLYIIGVDALIVQDMGILRLDIPPIPLHASTQCDTRTPEKARFLQDVGFSQIVLARELTLQEIEEIHKNVSVPLECFVHGALCVSYSGRCHASQAILGRSANRGECAQICRFRFSLMDSNGRVLERGRHLLSLKDFNASDRLEELMRAGASSFKIEGRLKEMEYVKNITAYYRTRIDEIISSHPDLYRRSSAGRATLTFSPSPVKSFNRGFTHYFLDKRRPEGISSPLTPKSMGEVISDISRLNNGDGISFFNADNEYEGVMVNGIKGKRIIGNRPFALPKDAVIHRTLDAQWQKLLAKPSAERRLSLDITLRGKSIYGIDERGVSALVSLDADLQEAKTPRDLRMDFDKLGNSIYRLSGFNVEIPFSPFIPASQMASARRRLLEALQNAGKTSYVFDRRRPEDPAAIYPSAHLDYRDNVANALAREFYISHGVRTIEPAMEIAVKGKTVSERVENTISDNVRSAASEKVVMTTRHCILRERSCCLKRNPEALKGFRFPLILISGPHRFPLRFDCSRCEMQLLSGLG